MLKYLSNSFVCLIIYMALMGCSTSRLPVKDYKKPVNYTIIYLIHGDANYLYHNQKGKPLQADKQVLREAKWVGRHAENGEVFIYHLKPETNILFFFPRKDRRFLYYRNGELVYEKKYSPHSRKQPFVTEVTLYHSFHQSVPGDSSYKKVLLYFGHEVPVKKGTIYFRSRPEAVVSTTLFAEGVESFLPPKKDKFDLVVLSTCDNGSPLMVQALSSVTDYMLASPLNLHLSHIDTKKLYLLEKQGRITAEKLATEIAEDTFNRLASFLQTVISLTLYEIEEMNAYLDDWTEGYKAYLKRKEGLIHSIENVDCSSLSFFNPKQAKKGIKVWYKPPQFGRNAGNKAFSGWGCKSVISTE